MATELTAALEAVGDAKPRVVHDHGSEFVNRDVAAVIKAHNLIDIKTKPRHPESNGIVERFNGTVRDAKPYLGNYPRRPVSICSRRARRGGCRQRMIAHQPAGRDAEFERSVTLCAVVGVHALFVFLIWVTQNVRHHKDGTGEAIAVWVDVRQPIPTPKLPPTTIQPASRATSHRLDRRAVQPQQAAVADSITAPQPQINWKLQGNYHSKRVVEDNLAKRYRNLGARRPETLEELQAPKLFESEKQAFGEQATDINGNPIVRLSKYCYMELDERFLTANDMTHMEEKPMRKCIFPAGMREVRGDLFEHLKRNPALSTPSRDGPDLLAERTQLGQP